MNIVTRSDLQCKNYSLHLKHCNTFKRFISVSASELFIILTFLFISGFSSELLAEYLLENIDIKTSTHITDGLSKALEDSNPLTRRLAINRLVDLGEAAKDQAPALGALLKDQDNFSRSAIFGSLINTGPYDVSIVTYILNISYIKPDLTGELRFIAHLVGGGEQATESLIAFVGNPSKHAVKAKRKLICRKSSNAIATVKTLDTALTATLESSKYLRKIQEDISYKIATILHECGGNFVSNSSLLTNLKNHLSAIDSPHVATVNDILKSSKRYDLFKYFSIAWFGHAIFWVFLLTAYPKSKKVQATFFWNPWFRRIAGLGYVSLALTWVPFLRNRLFIPFKNSLIEEVTRSDTQTENYYEGTYVTNKTTKKRGTVTSVIPDIKGQTILEGESGLGKTMFLHHLVQNSSRLAIYLTATQCKAGVIEAIQNRTHGIASDTGFLQSLIYGGALDICIDGLNEVSPDTRATITLFVDKYKGNIVIGTQPIEWVPPNSAKVFVFKPLERNQIQEFLLSRKIDLGKEKNLTKIEYEKKVTQFLEEVFDKNRDKKSTETIQRVLSNPMDLSVVAHMLYLGQKPDVYGLQAQQFQTMAEDFKLRNNGRNFPLQIFAKTVYMMRLNDEWRIPSETFIPELECMARHKMVLTRQYTQDDGNIITFWQFRHDKIMDYFIVQTFLGANNDKPLKHIKDPRFRGVYFFLATLMPLEEADILREQLILYAANANDHSVSDSFIKILHARQN